MQHVIGLLQWDQETYMPEGAVAERSDQLALLEGQVHERQTSPEMGELIAAGEARSDLDEIDRAFLCASCGEPTTARPGCRRSW